MYEIKCYVFNTEGKHHSCVPQPFLLQTSVYSLCTEVAPIVRESKLFLHLNTECILLQRSEEMRGEWSQENGMINQWWQER